ncbi:fructose-6-phosphate aldolase [Candidatus Bathyarchaeota archaeon]|jgi:transaldolase|nr:MAG: fructose-6-phosphate aldolase [Candidatus Bathyarchaeota archaeon]
MEIYIDTAEIAAIKKYWDMGVIDGVTTNPTLIARSGRVFSEVVAEIAAIVKGPISVEAVSNKAEELITESKKLAEYGKHIVIKIPMTAEGLKATKELTKLGIKTNVTLIFSASQALLAAKAGATYVSIFVGRLDDNGHEGMDVVWETSQIFQNYGIESKIITASIRHPRHVIDAAKAGSHVATIPPSILDKMIEHPLTDNGLAKFAEDWAKVSKS